MRSDVKLRMKRYVVGSDIYVHELVDASDEVGGVENWGVDSDDVLRLRRSGNVTSAASAGNVVCALISE